jgi:DNA-directed RNA polymerase subunit RPC12/RpoP
MGFPSNLNGKPKHLPSVHTGYCPNCGREFTTFSLSTENNRASQNCPHCAKEIGADFWEFLENLFTPDKNKR